MTRLLSLSIRGYTSTKFLTIISIVISVLIVDISLSNLSDIIDTSTPGGITTFIAIALAYAIGQYLILQFVKQKSNRIRMKSPHFDKLRTIITIVQYILTAVIVIVILQTLANSYYYTSLLIYNSTISYSVAYFLILVLALKFFSWYKLNRNLVVLSYGIASILISVSIVSSLVFFNATLLGLPTKINPPTQPVMGHKEAGLESASEHALEEHKEVGHGPDVRLFNQTTMLGKVQIVFAIFHVFSFLSLWASTVLLLHTYSQKLGKAKFWVIISIPLALYVSVFVTITPFVQSFPNANSSTFRIADVLGYIVPAISSSILFGLPFWMIARTMNYDNSLKDYLIIASSGLVLLQLAWTGNVILASYPPFGFASVSFVGLSSYLILMGIYSSTISISTDQKLRKSIKKYVIEEYRLLDSIATAQMEQDIQNIVVKVVEANLGKTKERTDIEALIKEEDVREYLHDVLSEIYAAKNKERAGNIDS